ncbi:MAG: PKD domain-containing protein [Thermoplasmatota archaeon]
MALSIGRREITIGIVVLVVAALVIGAYFYFSDDKGTSNNNGGNDNDGNNRAPIADAGYDQVIFPGEEAVLNASRSSDPDGDPLTFIWDVDASVDSDSDGIKTNDKDIYGEVVTYMYPPPGESIVYIATVNVSDGEKWSTSITQVTILIEDNETAPEVSMSCTYQGEVPYVEAKFIVTIDQVSSAELMDNFSYVLEDPYGELIQDGILGDLMGAPLNASLRIMLDTPPIGRLNRYDSISFKESDAIVEGCYFTLYYKQFLEPVGEVELTK